MTKSNMIRAGGAALFLILAGCSAPHAANNMTATGVGSQSNQQFIQAKVAITITDQSSNMVYSDNTANSSLVLKAGQNYTFNLNVQNAPAGATYSLVMTNIDQINGTPVTVPLVAGDNSFMVPAIGDYTWQLQVSATGYSPQVKSYTAQVTCVTPTFTADSLNGSAISVTAGGGSNLYNFSAAGVTTGANGMPPYQCAWDLTGVGIVDTGFSDCGATLSNQYVNYVLTRNVGVIVKDSCNIALSASNPQAFLAATEPTMPGNVFIWGVTSNATASAATDPRTNNVTYLATNSGGHNIVIPHYGSGNFTIEASQNYGQPSSVKFGVQIQLQGFKDTINNGTPNTSPTIDTSGVTIKKVTYITDQAGDQGPSITFNSTSCTLSNLGAKPMFITGQPCSTGTTGDTNKTTVEVWGHYKCTGMVTGSGATIDFEGDFDGMDTLADSCVGGGQGGGGIVPITL